MIKVSIIIPLHNAESYISETLQSCLKQTYENIEVLVVENGSSDDSLLKAKAIKDQRLKVFKIYEANAAAARNYGYQKATGDFISFLDADDVLAPNKIELQVKTLVKNPVGCIASCAWAKFNKVIDEAKILPQPIWTVKNPIDWCVGSWKGAGIMIPGCWLIPRMIIEKAGLWDERLSLHDDGEFMCRVLLASKNQVFVNDTCVYYRQVEGSLSRNNKSEKAAVSALEVCKSYERNILNYSKNEAVCYALAYNYRSFIYEFYPNHKQLLNEAQNHIQNLNCSKLPLVGGENFKKLTMILGFKNSLYLKQILTKLKTQ